MKRKDKHKDEEWEDLKEMTESINNSLEKIENYMKEGEK
jgi:hypothetical protein